MNEERIQELMNEAGLCGYGERYGEYIIPVPAYKNRMNRFAELIVKECGYGDANWRSLTKQYDPLTDRRFIRDGQEYTFVGLLCGSDDYYFCMAHLDVGVQFFSCVCNLETYGFELVVVDDVKKKSGKGESIK